MPDVFAGREIVEISVQIEKNGMDYYNALIKKTKNMKAKEVFKYLAGEEEKHIIIFKNILDALEKYEPQEVVTDEYFAYMNALASEHVFTIKNKGLDMAGKTKSDKEAIRLGIGFEKDSIIFYEGMKNVVPERDKKTVDAVIEQEKTHLRKLSEIKSGL